MGNHHSLIQIDDAEVGGCRVGDVSPFAVLRHIDKIRARVDANGRNHGVRLGINHADIAGPAVDHIDFVLFRVDGEAGRFHANVQRFREFKRAQIDDADGVAFAVTDISVLAKGRAVVS